MRYLLLIFLLVPLNADNLLRNSSFELKHTTDWGRLGNQTHGPPFERYSGTQTRTGSLAWQMSQFGDSVADGGSASNRNSKGIVSCVYRLEPSTEYTFSIYAYADYTVGSYSIVLKAVPAADAESGGAAATSSGISALGNQSWNRHSVTFTTGASYSDYYFTVEPISSSVDSKPVYLDDAQLETGASATAYDDAGINVELGSDADTAPDGYVWDETETVTLPFIALNNTGGAISETVVWEIYNFDNEKVDSGTTPISTAGSGNDTFTITGPSGVIGPYRCLMWVDDMADTLHELVFTVVPEKSATTDGPIGSHIPPYSWYAGIANDIGLTWTRTLSVGRQGRWDEVETSDDTYNYYDSEIAIYDNANLNILMTLTASAGADGANQPPDLNAFQQDANGWPDTAEFEKFAEALSTRYNGVVDAYEIWNEPEGEGNMELSNTNPTKDEAKYADVLEAGWTGIQSGDSAADVVGMVTFDSTYMNAVIADTGTNDFDIISTHHYFNVQLFEVDGVKTTGSANSKTVWNTETGQRTSSWYKTPFWETIDTLDSTGGKSAQNPESYSHNQRLTIGNWFQNINLSLGYAQNAKYFYYDGRATSGLNYTINYTFFELNGAGVKPLGSLLSGAAKILATASGEGSDDSASIDSSGSVEAWSYDDGADAIVAIRANTGSGYTSQAGAQDSSGGNNAAFLTDAGKGWKAGALVGLIITNNTDGSSGPITANTTSTITATLAGGTDNDWDINDTYAIGGNPSGALADITISNTSGITVYDCFGEPITDVDSFQIDETGAYIVGTSMTPATLVGRISASSGTDTAAPNISLVRFPTDGDFSGKQRIKWYAQDDKSRDTRDDSVKEAFAIEYRYKLDGVDGDWSAWQDNFWADYADGTGGTRFTVEARDEAGNTTAIQWPAAGPGSAYTGELRLSGSGAKPSLSGGARFKLN